MRILCLLIFIFLGFACTTSHNEPAANAAISPTPAVADVPPEAVTPNVPKDSWEPLFFRDINRTTGRARLERLRNKRLKDEDVEARVWLGFGLTKLRGVVIARRGNKWSAIAIEPAETGDGYLSRDLAQPSGGWETAWASLLRHGLFTLPDAASINCNPGVEDGFSYVVEIKKGQNYRTYLYGNPDMQFESRCSQAHDMLEIARIISQSYGVPGFGPN
jgi:hypothetical protein